jgi:ADP-dependent NAD(P)H-hydrate dehydratase / NAD(P)H-hydrate epimerase
MAEILTPEQMYRADALAVEAGVPSLTLMENAGKAVAAEILRRFKKCRVAVICGPGNNGGDGFVVARLLRAKKWTVDVYLVGDTAGLKGDCALMAKRWKGPIESFQKFERRLGGPMIIVDAIYGAGLNRDFPGYLADGIHGAGMPVVSIDVPSGLDGLTGLPRHCSVKADLTVTFFRKKPAHVLYPGRAICGEILVADIGIADSVLTKMDVQVAENAAPDLPELHYDVHKYSRGGALMYSGGEFNTGAARLAAMAAARSGAGAVSICGEPQSLRVHAAHVSSIMLKPCETPAHLADMLRDKKTRAFCIGPGAGLNQRTRAMVKMALASSLPLVLDADALRLFVSDQENLFAAVKSRNAPVVMTPHEGEFSALFGTEAHINKIERTRDAAKRSGAIVLLKGPDTVIAHPDGRAGVNMNGTPKLATAGSGDVLAGIITGLLAQGIDAFDAARGGAWLHSNAANRIDRRTIIAEDLLEAL